MPDIITIGGVTQDIFVTLTDHAPTTPSGITLSTQTKQEVQSITPHLGGGAANTATWFARQGFATSICALRGTDEAGRYVEQQLASSKVDTTALLTHPTAPTGTSVIIRTPNGTSAITAHRGANSLLHTDLLSLAHITAHRYLYITSLSHNAAALLPDLVRAARATSTLIACNPGSSQLKKVGIEYLAKSLAHIDVLLLNADEATLCAQSLIGIATKKEFAQYVLARGPRIVGITDGPRGVHVYTADHHYHRPTLATQVVDTVGAGDAFGAGFIGSLINHDNIEAAITTGLKNSARALAVVGSF